MGTRAFMGQNVSEVSVPATAFVGRERPVERLHEVLDGRPFGGGKLTILSIEGPGGVGKTRLLDHVLVGGRFTHRNYLVMRLDGGANTVSAGLFGGVSRLVNSARATRIQAKPAG